jgi:hypothetical protein
VRSRTAATTLASWALIGLPGNSVKVAQQLGAIQPPGSHRWLTLTKFGGIVAFALAAILVKLTAST